MSTQAAVPNPAALATPDPLTMAEVLRGPVMRRLFLAQLVSTFGDFLALFAVINYLTFHLDATPQQVTGLQIAYLLPIAILGVLAGVFVDRWPLKPTLVASDFARAGLCLLLLFGTHLTHFYLILAGISVVSSFFGPAQGIAIRFAVPLHGLRSANALMQQVMFGMRIIGPPLAGVLYTLLGARSCYWADSASFIASGCLLASLALGRPTLAGDDALASALHSLEPESAGLDPGPVSRGPESANPAPAVRPSGLASVLPDMREGVSFILGHAALLFVILALAAGMFVIGCFGPLIAIFVRDTLHASTTIYSAVTAMIGLGMLVGVNVLNTAGKRLSNSTLVYAGLGGIAAGLLLLTTVPHTWAAILANLAIGIAVSGIVVPANVMIQSETPPALMGRVGSTVMSLVFTAQILGLVLSGLLADRIGVRPTFGVCAVLLAFLVAAGKLWMEPRSAESARANS